MFFDYARKHDQTKKIIDLPRRPRALCEYLEQNEQFFRLDVHAIVTSLHNIVHFACVAHFRAGIRECSTDNAELRFLCAEV